METVVNHHFLGSRRAVEKPWDLGSGTASMGARRLRRNKQLWGARKGVKAEGTAWAKAKKLQGAWAFWGLSVAFRAWMGLSGRAEARGQAVLVVTVAVAVTLGSHLSVSCSSLCHSPVSSTLGDLVCHT